MAADRKKAGPGKRRGRSTAFGVILLIFLVCYVSLYLKVRPKAWVQPHPIIYPTETPRGAVLIAPENTVFPTSPFDRYTGGAADVVFMPLVFVEWVCCKKEVYFEQGRVSHDLEADS